MRPFLHRLPHRFWWLQAIGWLAYGAMNFLSALGYGRPWQQIYLSLGIALSGFVVTSLLRPIYRRLWMRPLPRVLAVALPVLALAAWAMAQAEMRMTVVLCDACSVPPGPLVQVGYLGKSLSLLTAWSGLYFLARVYPELQRARDARLAAVAAAQAAQLRMLRYQLNPHFLFNALNALSTLILEGSRERADRLVARLGRLLRHTLEADPARPVTLAEELSALQLYLDIERVRFGERLRVERDIAAEVLGAAMPGMLLQPLIENAVLHAVAQRRDGGRIVIGARREDGQLVVSVRDNGPDPDAPAPTGNGIGLANVRERLRLLFGDAQSVVLRRGAPGTEVILRMPFSMPSAAPCAS